MEIKKDKQTIIISGQNDIKAERITGKDRVKVTLPNPFVKKLILSCKVEQTGKTELLVDDKWIIEGKTEKETTSKKKVK